MFCIGIILYSCFFFNDTTNSEIYTYLHTLSLHFALPISPVRFVRQRSEICGAVRPGPSDRPARRRPDELARQQPAPELDAAKQGVPERLERAHHRTDRKSTRLNSSH